MGAGRRELTHGNIRIWRRVGGLSGATEESHPACHTHFIFACRGA